jgi:hypothetical protein
MTPERYREYFKASIPAATVEKIKANWGQSKAKISALGVSGYEGVEFALQRELAQAKRDLRSASLRRTDNPGAAQPEDSPLENNRKTIGDTASKRDDDADLEIQTALSIGVTESAQEKSPPPPAQPVDPLEEFHRRASPRVRKLFSTLLSHPGLHEHSRVEHWYFAGADQQLQKSSFTDLVLELENALSTWGRKSGFELKRIRGSKFKKPEVELIGDRQLLKKHP